MKMPDRPTVAASLIAIHMTITRGIDVTIEKSETFAKEGFPSDSWRQGFADYVRTLVRVVDAHHLGEDEVAFPFLRRKVPEAPYDTLHAEHEAISPVLDRMRAAADEIAASERPAGALTSVREAALHLKNLWRPHIATEEQNFAVDILAERLAPAEQEQLIDALGADSQKRLDPPFLAMPFVLYNLPPEERAYLASTMPPVLTQQLVPVTWKDLWAPMKPFLLA